jgi:hypothetical protein
MPDLRRYAADLARDLRAPDREDPVASLIAYADDVIDRLRRKGECVKLSTLVDWIANKLGIFFVTIESDEDLMQLRREYASRREFGAARLAKELDAPDCFGGTFALKHPLRGIKYVAVIDRRGAKRPRFYFTKCHEIAHILLMTDQRRIVFRRTHEEQNHPEEQLVDRIAARIGFFPALLQPYMIAPLSFDVINQIISDLCPEASWESSVRGVLNAWPYPAARIRAELRLKRKEEGERHQGLLSFLPPKAARLRIESVALNEAAERAGFALFQNMRVPESSIISSVFNGAGAGQAREDLASWESKGKGPLRNLPLRVVARRTASGAVEALLIAGEPDRPL